MTETLTSVTGRTITRPITSAAGSRIDDVYGVDGEDGDEDADDDDCYRGIDSDEMNGAIYPGLV